MSEDDIDATFEKTRGTDQLNVRFARVTDLYSLG
jgi:hypothetical protein